VGQKTAPSAVSFDPQCYLCPGNARAGGAVNPVYDGVFSFVNDYALPLMPEEQGSAETQSFPLLVAEPARGFAKCFATIPTTA